MTCHQPYHPMNLHPWISSVTATGHRASVPIGTWCSGSTLSYRALAPNGSSGAHWMHTATALHLRPRRWLHARSTANYSLLTANSFYTFSAKEKDVETGLSYFGSRYYSSDLSIWLSVDPQSDKYAYQSGYVYCGNNPIKIVDPDGEDEWEVDEITGRITHYSNDKPDRLFVTNASGQRRDDVDPLDVDKSIMDHMLADDTKTVFFIADKRDEMNKLFDYLADNTCVEWSHIGASYCIINKEGFKTINSDMIFTRHQFTSCNMWFSLQEFASNGVLDFHKHSHPNKYLGMNPFYRIMYPGTSHIPSRNDYSVKNSYPIPEVPFKQPFFLLRNGKRNIYY